MVDIEELNDTQKLAADVDGDGRVSITDVNVLQKYLAGIIDSLPVENMP